MGQNRQHGNVGNLGDILKHAALVQLATLLRDRNPSRAINYLETHAFVPQASIKNAAKWNEDINGLTAEHPAYQAYREIEKPLVDQGQYLCSTGLAIKILKNPRLFLAEKDPDTFQELKNQLRERGSPPKHLLKAMEGFADVDLADDAGPVLALFDPFRMPEDELRRTWWIACQAIAGLTKPGEDGMILVFQWTPDTPVVLPSPKGFVGPAIQLSEGPYHLFACATVRIQDAVAAMLEQLAWVTLDGSWHADNTALHDESSNLPTHATTKERQ